MSPDQGCPASSPRASLLPAFEPFSSSPQPYLPTQSKRKYDQTHDDRLYYPTPVPTSSTGLLPSSPGHVAIRPCPQRNLSTLSERAPLGMVPSIDLPANGDPVHMGRSSNSSDYQLSANRLISRVHVRATYHQPSETRPNGEVVVDCLGWNGCKVHVGGRVVELAKADTFRSDRPTAQIIVDVQDTRVLLVWPRTDVAPLLSSSPSINSPSPAAKRRLIDRQAFGSSPPAFSARPQSPLSSPSQRPVGLIDSFSATFRQEVSSFDTGEQHLVRVYEDLEVAQEPLRCQTPVPTKTTPRLASPFSCAVAPSLSALVGVESGTDHDEENDPAVQSTVFMGDNILSGFESLSSASPETTGQGMDEPRCNQDQSSQRTLPRSSILSPITNHVVNQLAFSRIHSVPLSTILANLPVDLKERDCDGTRVPLTQAELKTMLDNVPCVGEISREGKDAAGKRLENEFYYLPDMDSMESRRAAVSTGRPPIRNVRKQHKQYFWKRPRS